MAKRRKKKITKQGAEAPTSSCLLICEDVMVSAGSDKHFLNGVISEIHASSLPIAVIRSVAYVRLSNVYGGQKIALNFTSAASGDELFRFDAESSPGSDPLGTHTLILRIPPFEIPEAGRYIFSALHNDIAFVECPITVKVPEQVEP